MIALRIASEFRRPIGGAALGIPAMRWASMPEAAVEKESDPGSIEHNVRLAGQVCRVKAKTAKSPSRQLPLDGAFKAGSG